MLILSATLIDYVCLIVNLAVGLAMDSAFISGAALFISPELCLNDRFFKYHIDLINKFY